MPRLTSGKSFEWKERVEVHVLVLSGSGRFVGEKRWEGDFANAVRYVAKLPPAEQEKTTISGNTDFTWKEIQELSQRSDFPYIS